MRDIPPVAVPNELRKDSSMQYNHLSKYHKTKAPFHCTIKKNVMCVPERPA